MARLARGRIRHERYEEYLSIIALAMICLCLGHDDLFVVLSSVGLLHLQEYNKLVAVSALPRVASVPNFMDLVGGFDFWELTRFEKRQFRVLLELLQLPAEVEIFRYLQKCCCSSHRWQVSLVTDMSTAVEVAPASRHRQEICSEPHLNTGILRELGHTKGFPPSRPASFNRIDL